MLQYTITSWHYKLVNFVFGVSFFFEESLNHPKIQKERMMLEDKTRREFPNSDKELEKSLHEFHMRVFQDPTFTIYTKKKVVNFCPYCRAVVSSMFLFPFAVLYKLIPKRKPKKFDLKARKKARDLQSKIIMGLVGGLNIGLGIKNIVLDNSVEIGLIQIGIGIGLMFLFKTAKVIAKIIKLADLGYEKIKLYLINIGFLKVKTKKKLVPKEPRTPNFVKAFFDDNHSKYCPPVSFVDEADR